MRLPFDFYQQDGLTAAKALLGKTLVHQTPEGTTKGIIVEAEAYLGSIDAAAHAYRGRTPRTEIQFGAGGFAYVYLIYGRYACMNIVVNRPDIPECVLLRALEPIQGIPLMEQRRRQTKRQQLCSGPGKLCDAMAITPRCNGQNLCTDNLYLEDTPELPPFSILATPRIHVDYAGEAAAYPWRFLIQGSPYLSVKPSTKEQEGAL